MLIVEKNPKSITAECYRTLRTNIQFSKFDGKLKTLIVTSPGPSEGKSTTASNLAAAYSQAGKNVLLVDCDLRKPSIHKRFRIHNKGGLSNYLAGKVTFDNVIYKYRNKLHVITSGMIPPNPVEMLSSDKMKNFIKDMEEKYDLIILDTPPVLPVTDAQVLSTKVDGTILVVAAGQTSREACIKAKGLLDKVQANILGIVMSKVDNRNSQNYAEQYYYYYGEKNHGNAGAGAGTSTGTSQGLGKIKKGKRSKRKKFRLFNK